MSLIDVDKWQEIFGMLKRHKRRTMLTAFGVFWGIFMLVMLLGAGKGMQNGVTSQFGGTVNRIYMWSGSTSMPYQGLPKDRRIQFNDSDLVAIEQQVRDVKVVLPSNSVSGLPVIRGENQGGYSIEGAYPQVNKILNIDVPNGRFINHLDIEQRRKNAVIGSDVQKILFDAGENPIGETIKIGGIPFLVVGVYHHNGSSGGRNRNEAIYIANTTLRYTFNQVHYIQNILILPKADVAASDVEAKVKELLSVRHQVHPEDPVAIRSFNLQEEFDKVNNLFTGIAVFSWVVAIGTILAGVIGVGNIMLIVVKERTKEIGVRKALGATPNSIIGMIIQEALVITGFAGYAGLVLGVLLLESVNSILQAQGGGGAFFNQPEIDFKIALIAVLILMIAGTLAALLPAYRAAKIDPVIALQTE